MNRNTKILGLVTATVVVLVCLWMVLSVQLSEGIYGIPVLGAVFEMTWFPLLGLLFTLPFVWGYFFYKKRASLLLTTVASVALLSNIVYLTCIY